jgi:endonuclease III
MLDELIDLLEERYGKPGKNPVGGPLEMILWENVAYMVNDERRKQTYERLKTNVGISPQKVLAAPLNQLREVLEDGGMIRDQRVQKLSTIMQIVVKEFEGDLNHVLDFPVEKAKKALQLFPGIAEPGAEKILMFCKRLPVLALESNGLRVLLRLGYGTEQNNYSASYKSVRKAILPQIHEDYDWLIRAHQLLRIHGQQLCKRTTPICQECPLLECCKYGKERRL